MHTNRSLFFAPSRLQAAREFRGLTQKKLAETLGLTPMAVSGYERGNWTPAPEVVIELAQALDFPVGWFEQDEISLVDEHALSFRCQSRMPAALRKQSSRTWDFAALIAAQLRQDFNLPTVSLPDLADETPERAARLLRDEWRLGHDPIDHLIALLESNGVLVFWTSIDSRTVDAYCHWDNDNPIIVLNSHQRAGERGRFNLAHEAGHLILHREAVYRQHFDGDDESPEDGETRQKREQEANAFASAFLLPEEGFSRETPLQPVPEAFLPLKEYWGVSVAAMVRRNVDLGFFSSSQYERAMTRITMNGWRMEEPEPLPAERSVVHRQIFEALQAENTGVDEFARQLHINPCDLLTLMPLAHEFPRSNAQPKRFGAPKSQAAPGKVLPFPGNKAA